MTIAELTIKLRLDPSEPVLGTGPTVYGDLVGTPIVAVANINAASPKRVGEAVLALLRAAAMDEDARNERDLEEDDVYQASLQAERDHELFKRDPL